MKYLCLILFSLIATISLSQSGNFSLSNFIYTENESNDSLNLVFIYEDKQKNQKLYSFDIFRKALIKIDQVCFASKEKIIALDSVSQKYCLNKVNSAIIDTTQMFSKVDPSECFNITTRCSLNSKYKICIDSASQSLAFIQEQSFYGDNYLYQQNGITVVFSKAKPSIIWIGNAQNNFIFNIYTNCNYKMGQRCDVIFYQDDEKNRCIA
jgi:hypothetical protein